MANSSKVCRVKRRVSASLLWHSWTIAFTAHSQQKHSFYTEPPTTAVQSTEYEGMDVCMGQSTEYECMDVCTVQSTKYEGMDVCMGQSTEYEGMDVCMGRLTQYEGTDVCTVQSTEYEGMDVCMGQLTWYEGTDVCTVQATEYEGMDVCMGQSTEYEGMDGCLHGPVNWVWRHGCLHGPVDSVRRHGCLHGPVDSVQRQCLSALQTCSYAHHKTDNVRCTRFQLTDNDVTDVSTKGQLKHLTRWIPSNAEEWHRCQHCRPASADYKMNHFGHTSFGQLTTMAQMPPPENDSSTLHNQSNQLSLYGNAQTYNVIKQLEKKWLQNWARKDRTITDQVPADWPWRHGCQLKRNTGHGTVAAIKPSFSAARDN